MAYRIIADFVVFLHFLWIAFVILGFPVFLYLNLSKWRIFHLISLIVIIIMQQIGTICPLTYLEMFLKSKGASGQVYPGQFMIETIEKIIYIEGLSLEKISYATIAYCIVVLLSFWLKPVTRGKEHKV